MRPTRDDMIGMRSTNSKRLSTDRRKHWHRRAKDTICASRTACIRFISAYLYFCHVEPFQEHPPFEPLGQPASRLLALALGDPSPAQRSSALIPGRKKSPDFRLSPMRWARSIRVVAISAENSSPAVCSNSASQRAKWDGVSSRSP